MLYAKLIDTEYEMQQVLNLQQQYLTGRNTSSEEKEQGFVTLQHSIEKLKLMHSFAPSVIVKDGEHVIGYALVMLKEAAKLTEQKLFLFDELERVSYQNKPLNSFRFYEMGQVCVHKPYRGLGVFEMLYQKHKEAMQPNYDFVVTAIAFRNTRSIRAHEKVGFKTIHRFMDDHEDWLVILWDWNEPDAGAR